MADTGKPSRLPYGPGSSLWRYWTEGAGRAKFIASPTPFRTLRALLIKAGVPLRMVDGLTNNILQAVGLR